jgi:hypothetical protein
VKTNANVVPGVQIDIDGFKTHIISIENVTVDGFKHQSLQI